MVGRFINKTLSMGLQVLIGIGLLWILMRRTDFGDLKGMFAGIQWRWMAPALAFTVAGVGAQYLRWVLLMDFRGITINRGNALRLLLGARFLNLFLPAGVGGDVYRVYGTRRHATGMLQATEIVILERMIGFLAALLVGLVLFPLSSVGKLHPGAFFLLAAITAAMVALMILAGNRRMALFFSSVLSRCGLQRLAHWPALAAAEIGAFGKAPALLMQLVVLSGGMKLIVAVQIYFLAVSLGASFGLVDLLVYLPVHIIATSLPVSINSLGVREAALVAFFVQSGHDYAQAMGVALLLMFWLYATSIPCAVFLLRRFRPRTPVRSEI